MHDTISDLFEGRVEPPNETIAYIVYQAQSANTELQAANANVEQAQRRLENMQHHRIGIEAVRQQYLKDLEFLIQKEQDAAESKQEVSDGKPEPGSDQHGDDGHGASDEVAPQERPSLVSVQCEGSGGRDRDPGGEGDGGNRDDVQGISEDTGDRSV